MNIIATNQNHIILMQIAIKADWTNDEAIERIFILSDFCPFKCTKLHPSRESG